MSTNSQTVCAWSGYAFVPLYLIGFGLIAGFIPILPPSWDAAQVADFFGSNTMRIKIGMSMCVIASALLVPWTVVIFGQLGRITSTSCAYNYVQLISGSFSVLFFMLPSFMWLTMVFREFRNPELLAFFNDFAWICWAVAWPTFTVQLIAIALAVLSSNKQQKLIPSWVAYLSLWMGISFAPGSLVVFFTTGPFAWNGLIAVYLPLAIYTVWIHVMLVVLLRAIKSDTGINLAS